MKNAVTVDTPVAETALPIRLRNELVRCGLTTVGAVLALSAKQYVDFGCRVGPGWFATICRFARQHHLPEPPGAPVPVTQIERARQVLQDCVRRAEADLATVNARTKAGRTRKAELRGEITRLRAAQRQLDERAERK